MKEEVDRLAHHASKVSNGFKRDYDIFWELRPDPYSTDIQVITRLGGYVSLCLVKHGLMPKVFKQRLRKMCKLLCSNCKE